ncbi:MAG: PIG-L family deacetylase [Acidimicrobiales bacterium]
MSSLEPTVPTVMFVHAHPDDETTKGGGTAAWLASQGVRTVLVTCTDGAAGDVTDAALVGDRTLAAVRSDELAAAVAIMGFDAVHELGYPDSGSDSEIPDGFATRPLDPIVAHLAALIEAELPDVVVTYEPTYAASHPDHLRCHDISAAAFAQQAVLPSGPRKLYGSSFFSRRRVQAMHDWMVDNELDSPYEKALVKLREERFTTRIAIGSHAATARHALREHRTQIAHDHRWFYSIPDDAFADLYPWEEFELLAVGPGMAMPTQLETDLFA